MHRLSILFLFFGCSEPVEYIEIALPKMELSTTSLDFGEIAWGSSSTKSLYIENQGDLPMGLHQLSIKEEGFESNFSIVYNPASVECPEGADELDSEIEYHLDQQDTILNPGCSISAQVTYTPVMMSDSYAALSIESFIEPEEFGESTIPAPRFYRDPSNFNQTVLLHGYSNQGIGNIVVTPRVVDFGHHWSGESVTQQIMINNVGDGDDAALLAM